MSSGQSARSGAPPPTAGGTSQLTGSFRACRVRACMHAKLPLDGPRVKSHPSPSSLPLPVVLPLPKSDSSQQRLNLSIKSPGKPSARSNGRAPGSETGSTASATGVRTVTAAAASGWDDVKMLRAVSACMRACVHAKLPRACVHAKLPLDGPRVKSRPSPSSLSLSLLFSLFKNQIRHN